VLEQPELFRYNIPILSIKYPITFEVLGIRTSQASRSVSDRVNQRINHTEAERQMPSIRNLGKMGYRPQENSFRVEIKIGTSPDEAIPRKSQQVFFSFELDLIMNSEIAKNRFQSDFLKHVRLLENNKCVHRRMKPLHFVPSEEVGSPQLESGWERLTG